MNAVTLNSVVVLVGHILACLTWSHENNNPLERTGPLLSLYPLPWDFGMSALLYVKVT